MIRVKTEVPLSYITIKTTKSRIDKGLLAIPVSLIDLFPKSSSKIYIINDQGTEEAKNFTSYNSSSGECRIGGLKAFYQQYQVKDGNEIVIIKADEGRYKIIPEDIFKSKMLGSMIKIENAENEEQIEIELKSICSLAVTNKKDLLLNEFVRLAGLKIEDRRIKSPKSSSSKEQVPPILRKILLNLYEGKCQLTQFTFLMRNQNPYFEIHHINPLLGNHVKNLLVVCPNIHAQFTFSNVEHFYDEENWLRKVAFNHQEFGVFQKIDAMPKFFEKEIHS